ncbi:hypothetical protein CONCODRAFT_4728 [Conidiobolus coronatus NRRL 28638]|uniref:Uncharacterized protein n=1 Tax=Conidiobolus coronatus (strain ATCC 28846 / CBS 209.66 / NRRL 28638) TaxID=796925 RepID=A0A137PBX5_CONC2|nr:hypothetical protein CONCODRAFT_4728 [Conidiobolus coronatus NRRL 28638]|eukprot:KXN72499.1 hypothetical protein CONCODRAFT_4728 [Conidiobolus coronatus NRRL 28638]
MKLQFTLKLVDDKDPDLLADGSYIVGFPVGLVIYSIIFVIGLTVWSIGTIRRYLFRRSFRLEVKQAKLKQSGGA